MKMIGHLIDYAGILKIQMNERGNSSLRAIAPEYAPSDDSIQSNVKGEDEDEMSRDDEWKACASKKKKK